MEQEKGRADEEIRSWKTNEGRELMGLWICGTQILYVYFEWQ